MEITAEHYRVFNAEGAASSLADIATRMGAADVVFIGEEHDDPAAHHLELELLRLAHQREAKATSPRTVALSLEMFERDVQLVVDEYLAGLITGTHFVQSSRAWRNYASDYRPMVEYARENKLPVIAANAPRRYVNRVARAGRASLLELSADARRFLAPLPYAEASAAYAAKFRQLMGAPPAAGQPAMNTPHSSSLLDAQSLWDATMAHSIHEHLRRAPRSLALHVNGKFHSEERLGAPEHLARHRPQTNMLVVTIISDKSFPNFDANRFRRAGDFVIITDATLPRSRQ